MGPREPDGKHKSAIEQGTLGGTIDVVKGNQTAISLRKELSCRTPPLQRMGKLSLSRRRRKAVLIVFRNGLHNDQENKNDWENILLRKASVGSRSLQWPKPNEAILDRLTTMMTLIFSHFYFV